MKFFTPELYRQFNSESRATADHADQAWEKALEDYSRHLETFRNKMPAGAKDLADRVCLHDAEIMGFQEEVRELLPAFSTPVMPVAILSLRQENELVVLVYALWDKTRCSNRPREWPFSDQQPHWLYDEIDLEQSFPRVFWHRILKSDGQVIQIPFLDVFIHRIAFQKGESGVKARKGA